MIDATSLLGAHKKGSGPPIDDFTVQMECKSPRRWRVEGYGIERFTQMTNWTYYEALLRFQRVLEASGGCHCLLLVSSLVRNLISRPAIMTC